ncbi:MAG TPA: Ppx/GppA family phosphatase, partial [Halothiobacillus sp.]|nr:Ppx/GppA family phosphatase [Halothiobacillus sp.]
SVEGRRLVIDIGGGSTELIIGEGFSPVHMESVPLGCVSVTRAHFSDGRIDRDRLQRAEQWARLELRPYELAYRHRGWVRAVGSSGSARSLAAVATANGWSNGEITRDALQRIRKAVIKAAHIDKLRLEGLSEERQPVFVGGLVVMQAVFDALQIDRMQVSDGALREGLIYDWLGREKQDDVLAATVARLQKLFSVEVDHAERVAVTARQLFAQAAAGWSLKPTDADILDVAAKLHEIGVAISHSAYHHHGAYIIEHADMPGLTRAAQRLVASLVRAHRRKFKASRFAMLDDSEQWLGMRLAILLRLAVLLHRNRSKQLRLPQIELTVRGRDIKLKFPPTWLARHPLTAADLEREKDYLALSDFWLTFE